MSSGFRNNVQELWSWALPNFLPTLSLMISVFAAAAVKAHDPNERGVRRNFVKLTVALSVFYLVMLFLPFLGPLLSETAPSAAERLSYLQNSSIFLAPLQGLVAAALGVLFYTRPSEAEARRGDSAQMEPAE